MRTSELTGTELDYWVAKAEGLAAEIYSPNGMETVCVVENAWNFEPSADWSDGGPIIERETIELSHDRDWREDGQFGRVWEARVLGVGYWSGDTPLIAAMRAYVASKLGDEVS